MSQSVRKFVAVLMLLWLPIVGGNAQGASVAMQLQHCSSVDSVMQQIDDADECNLQHPSGVRADEKSCDGGCGLCHFSCGSYVSTSLAEFVSDKFESTFCGAYSASFKAVTIPLLDPPPITQA